MIVSRGTWWQWLLLALLLLGLLAGLAWLLEPYLPHLEPRLEAEARDRALQFSVRRPVEMQQAHHVGAAPPAVILGEQTLAPALGRPGD